MSVCIYVDLVMGELLDPRSEDPRQYSKSECV